MDPIHPILPHESRIPQVGAPPPYGRLTRDQRRERQPPRRRQPEQDDADGYEPGRRGGYDDELAGGEDELDRALPADRAPDPGGDGEDGDGPGLHIDITA
jgi:hypothetical protein